MTNKSRPNVLFIMADQMRADCIEAVNPAIKTPNIQRLVDNGVLFTRAYSPAPVCLPCRASVLTGQYPSTHGAYHNENSLPQDYPSNVAREFAKAGYYTHMIGKSHLNTMHEPNSPEAAPRTFNARFFNSWRGPWYGFEHADISIGHTTESVAPSMHYRAWLEAKGVEIAKFFGNTTYPQYGAWDLPEDCHSGTWIVETTLKALEMARQEHHPFFMWLNFPDPHNPCMVPEPWASMYDPSTIPSHGFKPGEPESFDSKPPIYNEILHKKRPSDPGLPGHGNVGPMPWTPIQVQENAAAYYGMVSLLDKHAGMILDALEVAGELDNTIIVFTSDHGDFLGDHGLFWKSIVAFEEAMHVPLVVSWPAVLPRGARSDALQVLVDLPATALASCGIPIPQSFDGVDQTRAWEYPPASVRDAVIIEDRPYDTDFHSYALVWRDYKIVCYANRDYGELYNMAADPDQVTNLWDDAECQATKEHMIARLAPFMAKAAPPQPTPTRRVLEEFPAACKEFDGHFITSGTIETDACHLSATVPFQMAGSPGSQFDVPMEDIIEFFIGKPIIISINGSRDAGIIDLDASHHLTFQREGGQRCPLQEALSSILEKPVIMAGFLNPESIETTGAETRYILYFKSLYD